MNEQVRAMGVSSLIKSMASRIDNEVDGLSRELLEQWADRMYRLECIADKASVVFKGSGHSKVSARMIVAEDAMMELKAALTLAGYKVV